VNAQGTKSLPGRKSDVQECQWLMKLHTYSPRQSAYFRAIPCFSKNLAHSLDRMSAPAPSGTLLHGFHRFCPFQPCP